MTIKRVLCPERVRQLPPQFSWVDQRLVRERYLERCDPPAAALYLFLVTVADAQGLSYYSEGVLGRSLSLLPARLRQARDDLIRIGLIAYQRPLYQVLAMEAPLRTTAHESGEAGIAGKIDQLRAALAHTP